MVAGQAGKTQSSQWAHRLMIEVTTGLIVASISIAFCAGFSALIFQGELSAGLPMAVWAMMAGTAVASVTIGSLTSMPPMAANLEATTIAMLKVLAVTVTQASVAIGASSGQMTVNVLAAMTLATLASGLMLYAVGALKIGQSLRFVPSPVTGGFLTATGLILFLASAKLATGVEPRSLTLGRLQDPRILEPLGVAFGFFLAYVGLRRFIRSPLLLPIGFGASALVVGLVHTGVPSAGLAAWYRPGGEPLVAWRALQTFAQGGVQWPAVWAALPDILAMPVVMVVTLVVRTSGFEVSFGRRADFNAECRAHGIGNIAAGLVGGVACAAAAGTTRLAADLGSRTALSSVVVATVVGAALLTGVDITAYLPLPLLAALLMIVGWALLVAALAAPIRQRAWPDLVLLALIVLVAMQFGFFAAVVVGFAVSCLIFAVSYSRVGVVRRHLTRATFSGNVQRMPEAERLLRQEGDAIHIYWLTGFIFFGSSDRLYEHIRSLIAGQTDKPVRYVIIDFAQVSGIDTSAVVSFTKLAQFCNERGIDVLFSSLPERLTQQFRTAGLVGGTKQEPMADHNVALAWCEAELLRDVSDVDRPRDDFADWLAREIAVPGEAKTLMSYFDHKTISAGERLYVQGAPADTIDIVAEGTVAVVVSGPSGRQIEVRRMAWRTVVGEMGFFRNQKRTADVRAAEPVMVYTLNRASFARMQVERPELASAFLTFVIRVLSDRLELANSEITGLMRHPAPSEIA